MSTLASATVAPPVIAEPRFGSVARAIAKLVSADENGPIRGVVIGTTGSGKTTVLRHVRASLSDAARVSTVLRPNTDIAAIPPDEVLVADDAHALDSVSIGELVTRAENPDAGLVIAAGLWPASPQLTALTRTLEHSADAILLSDISRADLRASLPDASPCEARIAHATGGIAWLVHECINAHEHAECDADRDHAEFDRDIELRISHRLDLVSPSLCQLIEQLALGSAGDSVTAADELITEGHAEGLLLRNGRPAPLVAAAARRRVPMHRLVERVRTHSVDFAPDPALSAALEGVIDADLAAALVARARESVATDPERATELFSQALACGADEDETAPGRAYAAWAVGDLDAVGTLLDGRAVTATEHDLVAATTAAAWAERGMMSLADQTFRAFSPTSAISRACGRIAAVGAGQPWPDGVAEETDPDAMTAPPSTIGITMQMLERGLRATLTSAAPTTALTDLQRASELYTASGAATPIPELPAVIAAIAAIGIGDLASAHAAVSDAIRDVQGGVRQQPHLQLWCSWVALQRERPSEAREALERATANGHRLTPRDDALAAAITVGLARRHEDSEGLATAWEAAKPRLQRTVPDLYTLLPLGELIISAARVGDIAWAQCAFDSGLRVIESLGDPPLWSTPLHWAGIQRGILLNRPADLAPHARALVTAAPNNRLAAMMAQAGRVWTAVLSGHVDPEAVESAANGLASVGLAWDGARLAGHGASRSEDRKTIARLLACARELHPRETPRADPSATADETTLDSVLSEREREVAELVVQGKTYAEIGAAIFISPRTAEHHIRTHSSTGERNITLRAALSLAGHSR